MSNLVKLRVLGIANSDRQKRLYVLLFQEVSGDRKLPIVIGEHEAQTIGIILNEEIKPPRPLTHDLLATFISRFGISIKQVTIHKFIDGVFYSNIICEKEGIEDIIDSRTSDAVALALRCNAKILIYEHILDKVCIRNHDSAPTENAESKGLLATGLPSEEAAPIEGLSLVELKKILQEAIDAEDYEQASRIKSLIDGFKK